MTGRRLASGGRVDRSRPLSFTWEGRRLTGYAGDTLASALLANGVEVVGRSFKLHRPRGLLAAGVEEPNALVQLGEGPATEANPPATTVELEEGLVARPVNCWPSAGFDLGGVNGLAERFIPAGFYYKTFMRPDWRLFEPAIRNAAGLGKPSPEPDPDAYATRWAHADVLVVGSGPAGLAAARAAAAGGARVMLVEQDVELGGSLLVDPVEIDGRAGADWAQAVETELRAQPEVTFLTRTTAFGYFDHNGLGLVQRRAPGEGGPRRTLWRVRAKRVVLATGALERPLVFAGNDRPGAMLASAVRSYLARHGVLPGARTVVLTNNDSAYATAEAVHRAGGDVVAVLDTRAAPPPRLMEAVRALGIEVLAGAAVRGTVGGLGGAPGLRHLRIRDGQGRRRVLGCDLLAMSGGWSPTIHLSSQSGARPTWDEGLAAFRPGQPVQAEVSAGACAGEFTLEAALDGGRTAGLAAAEATGFPSSAPAPRRTDRPAPHEAGGIEPVWTLPGDGKAFVDFQNDVSTSDIKLSRQEGFVSIEHLKRYTTLGMAVDQGKTSNVNALAIMAGLEGKAIPQVGTTRFRPPYTATPLAAFAGFERGALFRPLRRLPAHAAHEAQGATFEDYGGWLRPAYYARPGETPHAAEQREARAVRTGVGLFDGSPLGKIEVVGPDAATFLDRIYANTLSTLRVGKARYGLMLNELGVVIDDGVTLRLAEDRFLVGTTGAGAGRIAAWLEEWLQCEWPHMQVLVAPVTTAVGVVTLSGPKARGTLAAAGTDIDLDGAAFPHMSFRDGQVAGIPARVARVSFTGEVSFEVNVPAARTAELWGAFRDAGAPSEITPVGIDAWMLLRTEKGYIHVGADTDGTTSPDDIGWGHVHKRTVDFVGRRSLLRPDNTRADRPQFVGLEITGSPPPGGFLPIGSHLRGAGVQSGSEGYVTSSGFSPALGRGVALAMVNGGRARHGEAVTVLTPSGPVPATITPPGAYDHKGERLNG